VSGLLQRPRGRAREDDAPSSPSGRVPAAQPVSRVGARIGRGFVWAFLAWFVTVGTLAIVGNILRSDPTVSTSTTAQSWPGDDAKAYAATFASTLLTYSPDHTDERTAALRAMLVSRLDPDQMLSPNGTQTITGAWASSARRVDSQHANVTVVVQSTSGRQAPATACLSVPVARDDAHGLVVYDYPAPVSCPARASTPDPASSEIEEPTATDIRSMLQRFLAEQYMTGGDVAPEFLVPGAQVVPLGHAYARVNVTSVAQTPASTARSRMVLATVTARDAATGADLTIRYRIRVVYRNQRWLVQSVA
jgi:hypothetical protein